MNSEARRWLRHAVAFTLILLALATGVHLILVRGYSKQAGGSYGNWNRIVQGRAAAEIGVFGSSGALIDFDCEVIAAHTGKSCLNYGMAAGFNDLLDPVAEVLLAHNPPPKVAVLTLSIMSFMVNTQPTDSSQFMPYFNEAPMYDHLVSLDGRFRYWRYLPLYGIAMDGLPNIRFAIGGLMGKTVEPRPLGFMPMDVPWDGTFEEFVQNAPHGQSYDVEDISVKATERFLSLMRKKNVPVVLVCPPEWVTMQSYELNRAAIFQRFAEFARQNGAPLFDYTRQPISQQKELFYNPRHLNARGARQFSAMFAEDLNKVLADPGYRLPGQ